MELANLTAVVTTKNSSNIILLMYIATMSKTRVFLASFFVLEIWGFTQGFGVLDHLLQEINRCQPGEDCHESARGNYGAAFFLGYALIFSITCIVESATRRKSLPKSLRFWCVTMVTFTLLMAYDVYVNPTTQTYLCRNYTSIILCIHAGIILSFYRPKAIINNAISEFRDFIDKCVGFCRA